MSRYLELRFDYTAYLVLTITVSLAAAFWGWGYGSAPVAALGLALFAGAVFWKDLRQFRRGPLSYYFLFTIVFYCHRYFFKWGDPDVQTFKEQAPDWIRASKDAVWLLFLGYAFWALCTRRNHLRRLLWVLLASGIFVISALISFWRSGNLDTDSILMYVRRPLEYVPALILVGVFCWKLEHLINLGRSAYAASYVVLGFLIYEALTGADNGFNWGGVARRYGSVFGSPNDLGIFCVYVLIFVVCLWNRISLTWVKKMIYSGGFFLALILTVSLGAFVAFGVAASLLIWTSRQSWKPITVLGAGLMIGLLVFLSGVSDLSNFSTLEFLLDRSESLWRGTEASATSRIYMGHRLTEELNKMDAGDVIFGMHTPLPLEDYYSRIVSRQGLAGLMSLLAVAAVLITVHFRAWKQEKNELLKRIYQASFVSTATFFVSLATHPRLDVFPTNFYFWLVSGIPLVSFQDGDSDSEKLHGEIKDYAKADS